MNDNTDYNILTNLLSDLDLDVVRFDYYLEKIIKNREKFYELEKQKKIENDDKILEDRMKRYSNKRYTFI